MVDIFLQHPNTPSLQYSTISCPQGVKATLDLSYNSKIPIIIIAEVYHGSMSCMWS
jgi:hypothetical protein